MEIKTFFQQLLNYPKEGKKAAVNYEQSKSTAKITMSKGHIYVVYIADRRVDKKKRELCSVFDSQVERIWRHLDTMIYEIYPKDGSHIHCKVPKIKASNGQIVCLPVPWASENKRHTHDFENYAIKVLNATNNQTQAGKILQYSYEKVNRIMYNAVGRGLSRRKWEPSFGLEEDQIISIGIDEQSYKKGHQSEPSIGKALIVKYRI